MKSIVLFIGLFFFSMAQAHAVIFPGWLDWGGNPVHTEDEVDVQIAATVTKVAQGYRYTYTLTSIQSSQQNIITLKVFLPDPHTGVVAGTENSPWAKSKGWFPYNPLAKPNDVVPPTFVYPSEYWRISWVALLDADELKPGMTASGFTFVSPFPPGIGEAYVEGYSNPPVQRVNGAPLGEEESMPLGWLQRSKYGPGKVIPVIGPVKPVTPNVTDNYSVIGCVAGLCDVQLDITGPQDPYGTNYTYLWSGAFGTATGAKPVVQLAAGNYQVSVSVSDPYATLVTATMPITVVDPNPPVVTPPATGSTGNTAGNNGAGAGQGTGGPNGGGTGTGGQGTGQNNGNNGGNTGGQAGTGNGAGAGNAGGGFGNGGNTGGGQGAGGTTGGGGTGQNGSGATNGGNTNYPPYIDTDDESSGHEDNDHHSSEHSNDESDD